LYVTSLIASGVNSFDVEMVTEPPPPPPLPAPGALVAPDEVVVPVDGVDGVVVEVEVVLDENDFFE